MKYTLTIDTGTDVVTDGPLEDFEIGEIVETISTDIMSGDISGEAHHSFANVPAKWELTEFTKGIEIDRRQRLVAALMIMGFDLPAEMGATAASMGEASRICEGLTTGDFPTMGSNSRRLCLKRAQTLIEEMLAEEQAKAEPA